MEAGNDTDYDISEDDWSYSQIDITEAPANAEVLCIDVHYEIVHPRVSDLVVDLSNEAISAEQRLWDGGEGDGENLSETVTGITFFEGQTANQAWTLWAQDETAGQTGYLDSWWIKVYYLACPDATCSGEFVSGRNTANYSIPLYDWARSDIVISGIDEPAYVTCMDVHYEIQHTYVSDLAVDLSNEDISLEYRLWDYEGGEGVNIDQTITGLTTFANEPVNQTWSLWAIDDMWGDDGYIDSWRIKIYYGSEQATAEHDLCENAMAVENGVAYSSATAGATGDYETACALGDSRDVWHVYTAPHTALATVTLVCTNFDTTLALFDECDGNELVCSDDTCTGTNSKLTWLMTAGTDYLIRVAGYEEATGSYTLMVNQEANVLPDEPNQPAPADDAADVETDVALTWNGWTGTTEAVVEAKSRPARSRQERVIYGDDDRLDEYAVTDADLRAAGDATVVLVAWSDLVDNGDGTYSLPATTFAEWYELLDPLWTGNVLCEDEPFRNQPAPGMCSGVLVAPDVVATAGHCMICDTPSETAFIFGFVMADDVTAVLTVNAEDVYRGAEVVGHQEGNSDWSLVRLDRTVTNHAPVRLRRTGEVADDQALVAIGYPFGLPRKYDAGGQVHDNAPYAYFQANLDTYDGSSGSAVFNLDSMEIEGFLVNGNEDFMEDAEAGCDRSNWCPDTGCPEWESVTRATLFSALVPSFDVYLGTDPGQLELVESDTPAPWFNVEALASGTTYYWQVVARNCCGQQAGPVWSFTTR